MTAVQRQQTKWAVYGVVASVAGDLVTHAHWTFHYDHPRGDDLVLLFVHQPFFIASQLAVPLTIAFSMLQKLLWRVDLVVSKTVLYAVATSCIAAIWATVNIVVEKLSKESVPSAASATLVSGLVLKPLYSFISSEIDKRLRAGSFEVESEFPELTTSLRSSIPLARMLRVLVEHTADLVRAESAAVYLYQDDEPCWPAAVHRISRSDADAEIPRIDAMRTRLADSKAVRRAAGDDQQDDEDRNAPLAVPLTLRRGNTHDVIGVLALGRCTDAHGFTTEDLSALEDLGEQAGTAIYLARLKAT